MPQQKSLGGSLLWVVGGRNQRKLGPGGRVTQTYIGQQLKPRNESACLKEGSAHTGTPAIVDGIGAACAVVGAVALFMRASVEVGDV